MNAVLSENVDSNTLALLNKSEIDQQITTAKQYPRSLKLFREKCMEMATLTEEIATECCYAIPRGGKVIEGPSARLGEIVASAYGNCRAGARVVSEDMDFIVAQGAFHDLESNTAITYEVKRRITDKQGRRFKTDMIAVTGNAACSIALRNAIFKGVPKAFWKDIYDAARQTAMGDVKTLATRRADALSFILRYGVEEKQVCETLGVEGVEDIGLEELAILRGICTAIKDGDTTPEQAFGNEPGELNQSAETTQLNESIKNTSTTTSTAQKEEVQAEVKPEDQQQSEEETPLNLDAVLKQIEECTSTTQLFQTEMLIGELNEADHEIAMQALKKKSDTFTEPA